MNNGADTEQTIPIRKPVVVNGAPPASPAPNAAVVLTTDHFGALATAIVPFVRQCATEIARKVVQETATSDPATNVALAALVRTMVADAINASDAEASKATTQFVRSLISEATASLVKRVAELEDSQLTDGGTWKAETSYRKNQVVTCHGTLWIGKRPNSNSKPPSDSWRMMLRTGERP